MLDMMPRDVRGSRSSFCVFAFNPDRVFAALNMDPRACLRQHQGGDRFSGETASLCRDAFDFLSWGYVARSSTHVGVLKRERNHPIGEFQLCHLRHMTTSFCVLISEMGPKVVGKIKLDSQRVILC